MECVSPGLSCPVVLYNGGRANAADEHGKRGMSFWRGNFKCDPSFNWACLTQGKLPWFLHKRSCVSLFSLCQSCTADTGAIVAIPAPLGSSWTKHGQPMLLGLEGARFKAWYSVC